MIPSSFYRRRASASGFTLIEVMFVLALVGILAAVSVMRFSGPYQRIRFETECQLLKDFEATSRLRAIRTGRSQRLVFDLRTGVMARNDMRGAEMHAISFEVHEAEIAALRTVKRIVSSGTCAMTISGHGISPSYAVCLASGGKRRWLLFLGGSGQVVETENDEEIDRILEWHQLQGADAH